MVQMDTKSEEKGIVRGAFMFGEEQPKEDSGSDEEYDDLFLMDKETTETQVMSAEILVAIATKQKHVFKTYRGLVDTGTSASLMDCTLVSGGADIEKGVKCSRWKTQAGMFQTQGWLRLKKVKLPQITTKRSFQADFHLFNRKDEDQYRFILGRDVLQNIKLDILFSSNLFKWDHIRVEMVPQGHWSQGNIDPFWKSNKSDLMDDSSTITKNKLNSEVKGY